jgi:hypothetical protein
MPRCAKDQLGTVHAICPAKNEGLNRCMVGALRTLHGWYVAPDWRNSFAWDHHHGRRDIPAVGRAFEFRYQGWEVRLLTWQAYSNSLRERFESKLSEYEQQTRELAESIGLVRAQRKYSPDNLEWFVLYQFAGMSSRKIVDLYAGKDKALDESTVLKGVKAAARLIGWNRPGPTTADPEPENSTTT